MSGRSMNLRCCGDLRSNASSTESAVFVLRSILVEWNKESTRGYPGEVMTVGAEAWGVALFLLDQLRSALAATGNGLCRQVSILSK